MEKRNISVDRDNRKLNDIKQSEYFNNTKQTSNLNSTSMSRIQQGSQAIFRPQNELLFDKNSLLNQSQSTRAEYSKQTASQQMFDRLPEFTQTQNTFMMKKANKTIGIGEKASYQDFEKIQNKNLSMQGPQLNTFGIDGDKPINFQQSMSTNHTRNVSHINFNDNTERYRVPIYKDSPKSHNKYQQGNSQKEIIYSQKDAIEIPSEQQIPRQENTNQQRGQSTPSMRSPLNRQFTLSNLDKEEKKQGKKVFYSLKHAIKKDSRNQLQQLTIHQQGNYLIYTKQFQLIGY